MTGAKLVCVVGVTGVKPVMCGRCDWCKAFHVWQV